MGVSLVSDTISHQDIDYLREWLGTYPRLTKGGLTLTFEQEFSEFLGIKYSTFVNSGSSANLLMFQTLLESQLIGKGDKVIVPALSWATDLTPVIQLGLQPILCDCNLTDLSVDLDALETLIQVEKPKVLLLVSVLGLVPDMQKIMELCDKYHIILLEDVCESLGSEYKGKKLGTFGFMSSFSFYYGHHISTIEGGMACTNNKYFKNLNDSIRSHGWLRDTIELHHYYNGVPEFNQTFSFYYSGFNIRSTDLQAFIGLQQLKKIEEITWKRNRLYCEYLLKTASINSWFSNANRFISAMAFPFICDSTEDRNELVEVLRNNEIEYRPIICGSLARQPFFIKEYGQQHFSNADIVYNQGIYLPIHPGMNDKDIELICSLL